MDNNKILTVPVLKDYYNEETENMTSALELEIFTKSFKAKCAADGLTEAEIEEIIGGALDHFDTMPGVNFGPWEYDPKTGKIYRFDNKGGVHVAITHPIRVSRQLISHNTGELKVEIEYQTTPKRKPRRVIVPVDVIANNHKITQLANYGVSVTSSNARTLVTFLQDYCTANRDKIPTEASSNRFGWTKSGEFMPYAENVAFDGGGQFDDLRRALEPAGSFEAWLDCARAVRNGDQMEPKVLLAASFASVLVEPLGCLPFFTHIWGGTENGKTVALMLAASVWADPVVGRYVKSFNSTGVAQETLAGTLYSLPLVMDELQSIRAQKDFDKIIYELTEGTGRARGTVTGGLRANYTWANCMITSGEQPITRDMSGGGAKNRILEIEAKDKLFTDPIGTVEALRANYGHAGRIFVEALTPERLEDAKKRRLELFKSFIMFDYTEKQAIAASLVAIAEELASEIIFEEPPAFYGIELTRYMKKTAEVSKDAQAWAWLKGWIYRNIDAFKGFTRENYGTMNEQCVVIINEVYNNACEEAGVSPRALASYMKRNNYIRTGAAGGVTIPTYLDGVRVRCYHIRNEALLNDDE